MENQHRKITGYRELSQAEIDLMNKIKAHGEATEVLVGEVNAHLHAQDIANRGDPINDPYRDLLAAERIEAAQPKRWVAIATTDFQTGFMALTRAVAQPTTF